MQYQNINPDNRRRRCCNDKVNWKDMPDRKIITNVPDPQVVNNSISTTSSNIITFIPLNLLSQLSKTANGINCLISVYFLIISILQTIKPISNTGGQPLVLIPLSFVTLTVLIKDAYEEFYRYLKDREENNRESSILERDGFHITTVQKLRIGDLVRVSKDQPVPCDIVLLQTSDEKGRSYVQTKNLDGEANLKTKKVPNSKFALKRLRPQQLYNQRFLLEYEKPNPFLHSFNGSININGQKLPLSASSIILKGSTLKNVMWSSGVCVYTGQQTKLSLNSVKFKAKRSRLQKQVNKMVVLIFVMQFLLSLICGVMNLLLQGNKIRELNGVSGSSFWVMAGSWWLMMTYFVPISLVVTLQLVKLFQGNLMTHDQRMLAPMTDTMPTMNNSSVNQNLGQIKYIFSDKTGTLTSNVMNFKKLSVGGQIFGEKNTIKDNDLLRMPPVTNVDFRDGTILTQTNRFQDCFNILSLCHEVVVEKTSDNKNIYSSSSPDEIAIINFAKFCGYEFIGEQHERLIVYNRAEDRIHKYHILANLEFSSDRKRMSVVIQDERGTINLYTKGADNLVGKLLRPGTPYLKQTQQDIDDFSREGLRTLMLAKRQISPQQYREWKVQFDRAACSLNDRQKLLNQAYDRIEANLILVGATAVEDKLQDNVQDTIQKIKECNITFYILTGDKRQTAINIGRSCGMILPDTEVLISPEDSAQALMKWLKERSPLPTNSVLILNASLPLPTIPLHPTICYRCTPTQKEIVVKSVKSQTDQLTLAVGDGSNDVNMIIKADVGIGIKGREGNQVGRVADFVLGQFSLLSPLLLYYGREWYRRNSKLVNYSFFKNIYHVMAIVGFGSWSFFSCNIMFDIVMYQFFNVFFASASILVWAVVDEEYSMLESLNLPTIYSKGQESQYFNQWTYWKNILLATVYGIVSMLIVYCVMEGGVIDQHGRVSYLAESAMILYFSMVLVVNVKVLLMSHGHTPILLFSIVLTFILYWLSYFVYTQIFPTSEVVESFTAQFNNPMAYLVHFLLCFIALTTDFTFKKYIQFSKKYNYKKEYSLRRSLKH